MKNINSNIIASRIKNQKSKRFLFLKKTTLSFVLVLTSWFLNAQVTSAIDSAAIKIGEQITYHIQVETDTTSLVVFPEGQTFTPLEMIDSYKIDTLKNNNKYNLIKKYGLTQFDSGVYTIPRQKVIIGEKTFFTDSLKVEVNNIVVDTTKQGLYDIKPIIEVDKKGSNWWKYLLFTLLIIGIAAFLIYWFVWRKKPLTEEEVIALLPPYDRAKLALKKLDESHYLEHENLKDYYSELTFIIRKYLDEKVYDRALESTTDELISRLKLLKEGNQVDISKEDIKNLESILKRADLVKFAKGAPDVELAKIDRNTIDIEIDHVKEALPEPTEEEKLLDQKYKEEQERKKKRKKVIITVAIGVLLLLGTFVGFGVKYGFSYVKDTIIGHESKELLEGNWVTSAYGFPPVTISTPKVLKRTELAVPDEVKAQVDMTSFIYGTLLDIFSVTVNTSAYKNMGENKIDLEQASERSIKSMEGLGAKDIVVLRDKFVTPNGAEGLKTSGTMQIPGIASKELRSAKYVLLQFASENVIQQIIITSPEDDTYSEKIVERILNSVELKAVEE
ncbi:BatD family protein [Sabulilitoribacter arenilitoris]|uniref:BatD family protein n=1 Tax=Wocania arenilitoris TaxID=2044858 RepID=A0AAE3ENH2_9FLAO|nr:BatD family protein [Wocania arenilitoris]MCF7567334.1 BatD family protein [Wocania arenilitoris]